MGFSVLVRLIWSFLKSIYCADVLGNFCRLERFKWLFGLIWKLLATLMGQVKNSEDND